ncbi:type I methionyl aminopeptidase [Paenibacillus cucumis Kampfer et al. 2016]|uniref:Methionine aminopeptidase n=1 Tax=Paenibacillus cucumis (ex Kampfer et al. 2016) TaxID=1776858 RepID=A0ABS7KG61_9BACL|nr:type I methionyl aminopeptidase [Paenibacillus cucumis (ex Kampfer et al. 2016)]MBY0203119.1 type I methionyl aminopeptidase [Paenibacillus cucumis (ex Kampfer et al. 2016)]
MDPILKTREEIGYMQEAGRILKECHQHIEQYMVPGTTTAEINERVEAFLADHGATPEQKGYKGYPYATCASVNDVVCHGFPGSQALASGDVVTIDMVVNKDGWLADSAWTYAIDEPSRSIRRLMKRTEKALYKAIAQAVPGNTLGDIGSAIERTARLYRYGIVKPLIGHGIGQYIHEPPNVLPYGKRKTGMMLTEGMVITIEPIFTKGSSGAVVWDEDGWTVRTLDESWGVQYEHTVAITKDGPLILTDGT